MKTKSIMIILTLSLLISSVAIVSLLSYNYKNSEENGKTDLFLYRITFKSRAQEYEQISLALSDEEPTFVINTNYSRIWYVSWDLEWMDDDSRFADSFSMVCEATNDRGDSFMNEVSGDETPLKISFEIFPNPPSGHVTSVEAASEEDAWEYINTTYPVSTSNLVEKCTITYLGDSSVLDSGNEAKLTIRFYPYDIIVEGY